MKNLDELPPVLTVDEVASVLRISRGAAYESIRRGDIPALHVGRTIRVARSVIAGLLEDRHADPPTAPRGAVLCPRA